MCQSSTTSSVMYLHTVFVRSSCQNNYVYVEENLDIELRRAKILRMLENRKETEVKMTTEIIKKTQNFNVH